MKIIIIKLGYSETLLRDAGRIVSLGDVLRTTPVLYALKDKYPYSNITWVVSKEAKPLLHKNPLLDRLLVWGEFNPGNIQNETFDILINLEKVPRICRFSEMINSRVLYGFGMNDSENFCLYTKGGTPIKNSMDIVQKTIIEMLGLHWKGQEYILGYKPSGFETYDIGLNHKVGPKIPTKEISMKRWQALAERLTSMGYKVAWQEGFDDLHVYMDWINSCSLLVTGDSLGLHIAFALKKRLIGLFGPTEPKEIFFYSGGHYITSETKCSYRPCYGKDCVSGNHCMDKIDIDRIIEKVRILF